MVRKRHEFPHLALEADGWITRFPPLPRLSLTAAIAKANATEDGG